MNEPLRVQYIHVSVSRLNHTDGASTPFRGPRTLTTDESDIGIRVPVRQISGTVSLGDTATITGGIVVRIYNGYEFETPIEETEMTL